MGIKINKDIARVFYGKAEKYDLNENKKFRAISLRKAAKAIENLERGVDEIYIKSWLNGLKKINGVGNRIARAIEAELQKRGIKR